MVAICSFNCERNCFSVNACWPRNSIDVARRARSSSSRFSARSTFAFSSGLGTSTAVWAARSPARATMQRTRNAEGCRFQDAAGRFGNCPASVLRLAWRISAKTDQIFHHATKIAADFDVANEHQLIVDPDARDGLPLPRARINLADIEIEAIKYWIGLRSLSFLENFHVKLLHQ